MPYISKLHIMTNDNTVGFYGVPQKFWFKSWTVSECNFNMCWNCS